MTKHTPGPWQASPDYAVDGQHRFNDWGGVEAITPDGKYVRREICTFLIDEDGVLEDIANARLIAAAPDLLQACQTDHLLALLQHIGGGACECDHDVGMAPCMGCVANQAARRIAAAIAKATPTAPDSAPAR